MRKGTLKIGKYFKSEKFLEQVKIMAEVANIILMALNANIFKRIDVRRVKYF